MREMLPALTEWVHANAAVAMRCKHAADVVVEAAALATEKETKDWLMAALIEGAMTAMAAAPDAGSKKTDDDAMETDAAEEDEDEGEGEGEDRLEDTAVNHYIGRKTIRRLVDSHADAFGPPLLEELMVRRQHTHTHTHNSASTSYTTKQNCTHAHQTRTKPAWSSARPHG